MIRKLLISGFILCITSLIYAQMSTTTILEHGTTEQVVIEEYVPKVIIEGKWGTEPGEFGRYPCGSGEIEEPTSLAVDSKGNIYILDHVNNRIQKFNNHGEYLLSIPIDGIIRGEKKYVVKGKTYICHPVIGRGINIVIDSQDNLYYYCVKGDKGEVWWFKDDKLVKKWKVPVHGGIYYFAPLGLFLEDDDSVWIFDIREKGKRTGKHYEIKEKKIYTKEEREKKLMKKEAHKEERIKKITPLMRRRQFHLEVTDEGIEVIKYIKKR
ncbi:MAG: hypothetical protein QME68_06485 [Elusimicrobiota bacterium]|nr:hypothetical protein [Elusimicrobiota bacterium]